MKSQITFVRSKILLIKLENMAQMMLKINIEVTSLSRPMNFDLVGLNTSAHVGPDVDSHVGSKERIILYE